MRPYKQGGQIRASPMLQVTLGGAFHYGTSNPLDSQIKYPIQRKWLPLVASSRPLTTPWTTCPIYWHRGSLTSSSWRSHARTEGRRAKCAAGSCEVSKSRDEDREMSEAGKWLDICVEGIRWTSNIFGIWGKRELGKTLSRRASITWTSLTGKSANNVCTCRRIWQYDISHLCN
jgi:hypothetical protein